MQEKLLQRFLRYVAVPSQSNAANANVPSSEGQRKLAELLKQDLAELGLVDLEISEYSVLTGKLRLICRKAAPKRCLLLAGALILILLILICRRKFIRRLLKTTRAAMYA